MSKKKTGLWQAACLYVANNIPVEERRRSRAGELVVYLHYLVDYVILWVVIELNYNPTVALDFDWPFVIARTACVVLFVLSRRPVFFLAGKLVLLMQFVLAAPSFAFLDVLAGAGEVAMAGVWALTKEQRMLHFDSRFEIAGAFLKQLVFYAAITIQLVLPNGRAQFEGQFVLLGCAAVMALIDFSELYYSRLTKAMLLRLDGIMVLLALATIYQDALGIGFLEFVFASLFLFAVAALHLAFAAPRRGELLRLHSQELGSLPEEVLMEAAIELKRTAGGGDAEAVETYLFKLREEAEDAQLVEKIAESQEKDGASRQELLNSFIFQTLKRAAKSSKRLRDLVVYLYSPSPRLYCFLDLADWQHLREYRRIIAEELNDSTLREAEAEKELEAVKGLVLRFTRVSGILLQELMKERIRESKVEQYGEELIELLEEVQRMSAEGRKPEEVRELINRFALDCLPAKYQAAMVRGAGEGEGAAREEFGEVVVGGEEDNYLTVLETSSGFTKLAYLRKERYVGRPLALLLPAPLLAHLARLLKQLARQPDAPPELRPGFLFNALGFAVAVRWKAEATTHQSGRAWKLSLRQEHCERALLVVSFEGVLEGFSELGRYFGLAAGERGKRLQAEAVGELAGNSLHYLSMGESLFEDHEFYMPKGAVLCVLDEMVLEDRRFWLLEIKETDMKLKSLANPLIKSAASEPPQFEFHFDWADNRITTEPVEQRILVRESLQEEQRQAVNYGENITEMRYFQERIDYKSNFEEERDCPSLQPHLQRALSSLSVNEFHEKWDRKRNSAPLWFKASAALIVLLALVGLAAAIFYLTAFNAAAAKAGTVLRVSTKLQEKLQSVILLGELTTLPLYDPAANASQAILAQISVSNALSSELYALDGNIFNSNSGQAILNLLNALNLHINSYLLTPGYPYRSALALLTGQVVPAFNAFIASTVAAYANNAASARAAALIVLSLVCFGLFAALWLISLRQGMRRREVAEILKFIDNDDLEAMRERTLRFKETWLDNVDSRQAEEAGDEAEKESASPPKHLLSSFRLRRHKVFHGLWLAGFVVLLALINHQTSAFCDLAANYVAFENSLALQITALQTVWAELNQAAPNATLIQGLVAGAMGSEFSKNVLLKAMAGSGQLDAAFIASYGAFWESLDFCDFISDRNCESIIGGAMAEGANMAICYLNIQHDAYLAAIAAPAPFDLYAQPSQPSVALLSLHYLPVITQTSNSFILQQFDAKAAASALATQYYFIGLVLHSLIVLLLLQWAVRERKMNSRIEELLMIMPFEKLKNFSAFHKYYLKYYATF